MSTRVKEDIEREAEALRSLGREEASFVQKIIEIPRDRTRFRCKGSHTMITIIDMGDSNQRQVKQNQTQTEFQCSCGIIYKRR